MTGAGPRRTGLAGDVWVGLVAALAAMTVTPVAVPAILADLPTSLAGALWIVGAAAAGMVAGLILAPPLSRVWGTATVLWSAEIGLAVSSLLCALPATAAQLVAARAAQGLAAGLVAATALSTLAAQVRRRWLVVGVVGVVVGCGVLGVLVGAFAVTAPGWRAVFVIEALAAAIPGVVTARRRRRLGGIGATGPAALAAGLLLIALPLQAGAGAVYQVIDTRSEAAQFPPPGRLVDVGGHRLHLDCRGSGSPTVVLEADLGDWSLDWSSALPAIETHSRVCAYDRAGLGWSDSASRPATAAVAVAELRTLLRRAGEPGPFVAVGVGYGGIVARLWAATHAEDVAGLVLVDSTDPEFLRPPDDLLAENNVVAQQSLCALWSPIGLWLVGLQVGGDSYAVGYPSTVADQLVATVHRTGLCAARRDEALAGAESAAELIAAEHGLGAMPLAVLRHGLSGLFTGPRADAEERGWQDMQARLARLSSAGRLSVAEQSGHAIELDQPQVVADAVGSVVDAVRRGGVAR